MKQQLCKALALTLLFSTMPIYSVQAQEGKVINLDTGIPLSAITDSDYEIGGTKEIKRQIVLNPSFEEQQVGWNIEGNINGIKLEGTNAKTGEWALNYGNEAFTVSQTMTGLENGTYQLEVWVQGENGKGVELFAHPSSGDRVSLRITNTGWANWSNPTIREIEVTDGTCTIGITSTGGSQWGWIDDFKLSLKPLEPIEKTKLETLVKIGQKKVKKSYTDYSWSRFQEKLVAAQKVLKQIDATPQVVASVYNDLLEATDALIKREYIQYEEIHVNPIETLMQRTDFINGVDISSLHIVTQKGAEFYDVDGSMPYPDDPIKNALAILQNHGVNWVRLRIWNDPQGASQDLSYVDKGPGGLNDLEVTKEIAQKAKELGLKLLLDFHYSDTWVHPGQQIVPEAWKDMDLEALKIELYQYTDEVLKALEAVNALPDMVQIGNENNDGMVHPIGKIDPHQTDETKAKPYLELVKAGVQAVRDNEKNGEKIKVMIHLAEGGNSKLFKARFDLLERSGIDYDVIGASYYPYWHGSLEELQENLNDMATRYNKEIVIAETSYAYTTEADNTIYPNGTAMGNIFGEGQGKDGHFKATIQGQATAVRDVIEVVADIPNQQGIGTFYWEPAWLVTPEMGAGWGAGMTEVSWANQALFNYKGQALPSIDVYNLITTGEYQEPKVVDIVDKEINLTISQGQKIPLPEKVDALYSDDGMRGVPVSWEAYNEALIDQVGSFSIKGQLLGSSEEIIARIIVMPKNYIENPGFEEADRGWQVVGNVAGIQKDSGNAKDGSWAFNYGNQAFQAYQTLSNLPKGVYTFSAQVQGAYEKGIDFYIEDSKGNRKVVTATNEGWRNWVRPVVEEITIEDGECTIGFTSTGGGDWGWIDDVAFVQVSAAKSEKK